MDLPFCRLIETFSMKHQAAFYIAIFLPLIAIILAVKDHLIAPETFGWAMIMYALIYHPLLSAYRLLANQKINRSQCWLVMIPFYNGKYCSFLFCNNG